MSREIKEGNSSSGSSSSSSGSSNNNRSGASSTMRKDTSLPPSACPVSPPALSARKQHDGKFVKFCPDDLQRVIGGVGLSSTGESSSSCLLVLQESDSVSTADSTSCSSLSNEASSSSSSSNISTSHHHCPTTPSQTGLLRHRTSRDYSATLPLLANDTATISLVVEDGDLVDAQDYSPKHQQHPQHQHHQDHHHSFAQHYVSFKNKTSRRDLLNHVICSKKNCIVVAAHHQKQRLMTPRIILTWMLMMGMMLSLVVLDSYSSPYYGYYYFSSSSTSSSTTTTPPLPRLPSLLLTTTTTSDVSSGSENHHPLAMSARDTQKLLQKINHASSSSSLSSTTTTNKSKKQKNHHHHHHHFSLRLQGSRVDLLHMSLDQHATCPGVAHVQIDWTGPSPFVVTRRSDNDNIIVESSSSSSIILQQDQKHEQEQSDDAAAFVPFTLLHHASHKVGPVDAATTHAAVFLLHERLSLDCGDLTRAFAEWKKEPTRMVGFFPLLQPPPPPPPPSLRQEAVSIVRSRNNHDDDKMNARRNNYSLLSDRALFVHKLYLPEAMRTVLRQESSHVCREYMLAARIAAISNQAPVAMTLQNHHHYHHHFDEENVARLVPSRRMKEATTDGIDRLDCLPLLLEAVGKVSLPATDAVYIGRDVRPPSTNTASSGGGDKINDGPP